jgi:spore maturation protein CgeB
MKILLAQPSRLNTVPMGQFTAEALQKLGHEVINFNMSSHWYDKLTDRAGLSGNETHGNLNRRFRRMVDAVRPDLMLAIFGFDLSEESLDYLKIKGIARACWWLNDPFQFKRSLSKADHYNFLFSNSLGSVADYRTAGIVQAHWLPTACSPEVHRRVPAVPEYRCEICFAGDWNPLRETWCTELAKHFDIRIFGPWRKKLRRDSPLWSRVHDSFFTPQQMASIFASADVVFNLHSWYGKWTHGTNPRLFEAAGCGACQIVDWKEDIPHLFDTEHQIITYQTQPDLIEKVQYLLSNNKMRHALGENAQQAAYARHTYEIRMRTLLEHVG